MVLVPDPTLPEKFLGYSRESNQGPLRWQSEVLTTIANRRLYNFFFNYNNASGKMLLSEHKKANMFKTKDSDSKREVPITQPAALITSADNS